MCMTVHLCEYICVCILAVYKPKCSKQNETHPECIQAAKNVTEETLHMQLCTHVPVFISISSPIGHTQVSIIMPLYRNIQLFVHTNPTTWNRLVGLWRLQANHSYFSLAAFFFCLCFLAMELCINKLYCVIFVPVPNLKRQTGLCLYFYRNLRTLSSFFVVILQMFFLD